MHQTTSPVFEAFPELATTLMIFARKNVVGQARPLTRGLKHSRRWLTLIRQQEVVQL
jgi:hypothetical protein